MLDLFERLSKLTVQVVGARYPKGSAGLYSEPEWSNYVLLSSVFGGAIVGMAVRTASTV